MKLKNIKKQCKYCDNIFYADKLSRLFCSNKCSSNFRFKDKRRVLKTCQSCGHDFFVHQYRFKDNRGKFCSQKCYWSNLEGRKQSVASINKRTAKVKANLAYIEKLRIRCKSLRSHPNYWTPFIKGHKPWNTGIKRPEFSGPKHPFWKGGTSNINSIIRKSLEYKLWRVAVFERDEYTCQECKTTGCELHAHHIKPFSLFPELRLAIDNGVTLCVLCHKKTDTFGSKIFYRHEYKKQN
jgi:hypothetical protein